MSGNEEKSSRAVLGGVCAVCERSASSRCAGCGKRFYCGKEHQRVDWSAGHESSCRPWEIRESEELGRHLVASRDLEAGDLVASETPVLWGPSPDARSIVCVGCGDSKVRAKCPRCGWYACRVSCDGLVDPERHGLECPFLVKFGIAPRCDVLLILRALLLRRKDRKRYRALESLESHEEKRGPGTDAREETEDAARRIEAFLAFDPSSRKVLPKICGVIDVNALETNPPAGCAAIYKTACLLEHDCLPNTRHVFSLDDRGRPRITVTTVAPVKKGEHLSTMYTHALWSTRARREHLLATKYFSCRCERCADPTELGSHLGTLKCPCGGGLLLPNDPLDEETEWTCTVCPGSLSASEVARLTDRLADDVDAAMTLARKDSLGDLFSRLGVLLHPGHQHRVSVGHSLVQLLPPEDPSKAAICERLLETTSILDPHGARLALYTAVALRELASCPGRDRRGLLERARGLLRHEPPGSPGEKLRRLVETESAA